ncbi:MAG: Rrf2 family transcriptional regulator [Proteobacteria bacterium]|nr:Rrf2 family transcriptional regulator [Pseudomonadota bacterium]
MGLRCLVQVAARGGRQPLSIAAVAEAEGLSIEYAAKLLRQLRLGELVASTRGAGGGYRLARPADTITVWDALQALGGDAWPDESCACAPGERVDCTRTSRCAMTTLWRTLGRQLRASLENITLADLCRGEQSVIPLPVQAGAPLPEAR